MLLGHGKHRPVWLAIWVWYPPYWLGDSVHRTRAHHYPGWPEYHFFPHANADTDTDSDTDSDSNSGTLYTLQKYGCSRDPPHLV
jgi:hypothetical protein